MKIEAPSTSVYMQQQLFGKDVFKCTAIYRMYMHLYPSLCDFSFKYTEVLRDIDNFYSELCLVYY